MCFSGSDPEAIRKLLKLQPSLTGATHEKFVKRDWNIEGCRKAALQLPFASIHSQAILSTPSVYFAAAPSSACPVSCTNRFNMPGLWLVVILTSQSRLQANNSLQQLICLLVLSSTYSVFGAEVPLPAHCD